VRLRLVHRDSAIALHWRAHFGKTPDVSIVAGDIRTVPCDAIVSPANSFGFMDGGLDLALVARFGAEIQSRAQRVIREQHAGELLVGQAEIVPTGDAQVPWLIVAPTMRVPMHVKTTVNAYLALRAVLLAARAHTEQPAIETIAVPSLCTGTGSMRPDIAAYQMWCAYEEIVLSKPHVFADFGEAQDQQLRMNPLGMIYD